MKTYRVIVQRKAEKMLMKLDKRTGLSIGKAIQTLSDNPRPRGCKKVRSTSLYRIRVGDYRVVYDVKDIEVVVLVVAVGHRQSIYRSLNTL